MKIQTAQTKQKKTPVIGIAAEYNPFHNGHALHLARARALLGGDAPAVAVLSSSFTQRGLPALADKWTRARMALENGVDLVLELPFIYACNAGPEFARGAVDTLAATKLVTHLSFGAENISQTQTPDAQGKHEKQQGAAFTFHTIVDILIHEPPSFKTNLKKALDAGSSYPKAAALALDMELPGGGAFISTPNNSLALSYMLHARRENYGLAFLPVKREGEGYRDETAGLPGPVSAAAIRAALARGERGAEEWLAGAMPASALGALLRERERGRLCLGTESAEKLWALLRGLLVRSSPEDLRQCAGMDEGMENLFLKHYARASSYDDFIGRCVCARYTRGRLQRQAIRCLIGLDRRHHAPRGGLPYVRVLGFGERGRAMLNAAKKKMEVPLITRLAAADGAAARESAEIEFRASRLRELMLPCPDLSCEERQAPVIIVV